MSKKQNLTIAGMSFSKPKKDTNLVNIFKARLAKFEAKNKTKS